jgi:ribose 5-phosphate isomerase A
MADREREKRLAAERAVDEVQADMLVGLGTGSTSVYAVKRLGQLVQNGLKITATATSKTTEALARSLGIRLVDFAAIRRVDLTIDGADEIAPDLRAIKGGGGALLREKIVAAASDKVIAVVDSSKPVAHLGTFPLPVEVFPFASGYAAARLQLLGAPVRQRMTPSGPFVTDQDNFIFDLDLQEIRDPRAVAAEIGSIPGVVEHGLFLTEIDVAMIGQGERVEIVGRNDLAAG